MSKHMAVLVQSSDGRDTLEVWSDRQPRSTEPGRLGKRIGYRCANARVVGVECRGDNASDEMRGWNLEGLMFRQVLNVVAALAPLLVCRKVV